MAMTCAGCAQRCERACPRTVSCSCTPCASHLQPNDARLPAGCKRVRNAAPTLASPRDGRAQCDGGGLSVRSDLPGRTRRCALYSGRPLLLGAAGGRRRRGGSGACGRGIACAWQGGSFDVGAVVVGLDVKRRCQGYTYATSAARSLRASSIYVSIYLYMYIDIDMDISIHACVCVCLYVCMCVWFGGF